MRLHGFEQHSVRVKSLIMLHMQYGERGMVGRGVVAIIVHGHGTNPCLRKSDIFVMKSPHHKHHHCVHMFGGNIFKTINYVEIFKFQVINNFELSC